MPQVLELLPLLLTGATTGIGLAETLGGGSSTTKAVTPTAAQTADTANATKQNQLAALTQQTPNIQAQTGGSLSPEAWAQLAAILSGQAGNPGESAAGGDLIQKILTGNTNVTAGNNANPAPGSGTGLTNTTFA
jgi:hypothetical protein